MVKRLYSSKPLLAVLCMALLSCSPPNDPPNNKPLVSAPPPETDQRALTQSSEPQIEASYARKKWRDNVLVSSFETHWFGDFDAMVERRTIRALVVYGRTSYFLDGVTPRGIAYDSMKAFEKFINKQLNNKTIKVHVVYIPVSTEQLIPALENGLGDIAVANFTTTEERKKRVQFSRPVIENVEEIVVTGPNSPEVNMLEDLSGQHIFLRESSSYYQHILSLNEHFIKTGLDPIIPVAVNPYLEDEDILELVNAGMIPMTVVDNHIADIWQSLFQNINIHKNIAIKKDTQIAWAFRKSSPQFEPVINNFLKSHGKGTLFGNILFKRYLKNAQYVKAIRGPAIGPQLTEKIALFKKYADQYGFDWTMIAAVAYQESLLDQSKRSHAGAVGIMQVLPSTAADKKVNIEDIHLLENNIHAGIKYLRHISDHFFADENMTEFDKLMFSFAAYNAGPNKIKKLRRKAKVAGLDPNVWFSHVEVLAANKIGRETVQYVSNILKYWLTYQLLREQNILAETTELHANN